MGKYGFITLLSRMNTMCRLRLPITAIERLREIAEGPVGCTIEWITDDLFALSEVSDYDGRFLTRSQARRALKMLSEGDYYIRTMF